VAVLSDGLGSGVKANILATLTAKMLVKMTAEGVSVEECVSAVAKTLPVCTERHLAYSTFTLITIQHQRFVEVYQFDNPSFQCFHEGKPISIDSDTLIIYDKKLQHSKFELQPRDCMVVYSDGVLHAGVGGKLDFGWSQEAISKYLQSRIRRSSSAQEIAVSLMDKTTDYYGGVFGDDASVLCIQVKPRNQVNILVGPSKEKADDETMLSLFFSKAGRHIVCGGTTATIASRHLHQRIEMELPSSKSDIPPTARIEGVDLVTEGVITMARVLEYAKDLLQSKSKYHEWKTQHDGASLIAQMLFEEATDINFYSGCAVNPAHQNTDLPIDFSIKMQLVTDLSDCLTKMGKRIKVAYF